MIHIVSEQFLHCSCLGLSHREWSEFVLFQSCELSKSGKMIENNSPHKWLDQSFEKTSLPRKQLWIFCHQIAALPQEISGMNVSQISRTILGDSIAKYRLVMGSVMWLLIERQKQLCPSLYNIVLGYETDIYLILPKEWNFHLHFKNLKNFIFLSLFKIFFLLNIEICDYEVCARILVCLLREQEILGW